MSIRKVPNEVIGLIVEYLDLEDVYHLSVSNKRFDFLAYDDTICKKVLQTASPSALEAQQARCDHRYARAFRRLIKRREAISSASPFLTAVVALAESWLFENGVLCYIRERQLRLLDVHHSADREIVVNIRKLLDEAIPESLPFRKYKFQLLHQSHGIVSCLYTHARPRSEHWLVAFDASERKILTALRLASAYKIFVRNNAAYVYFGVQSDIGDDGYRRWVLRGFDIQKGKWFADSLHLPETVGSDFNATICFEIIGDYFCTLTNHTSFEMNRIEYTSYYDFFRFPLDRPSHEHFERPTKKNLFRRQHAEGPIDDRWTFMNIYTDERSNKLKIIEARKEWLAGNRSATRSYYTKTLDIIERRDETDSPDLSSEEEDSDDDQYPEDDQLAQYLGTATKSNKGRAPVRDPSEVHVGDDASVAVMFTLSQCFIRSYHPESQAFLDVVNDPPESDAGGQRIRIRVGTRVPQAISEADRLSTSDGAEGSNNQTLQQQTGSTHEQSRVVSWPPEGHSPALDDLHKVLNPPGYLGNVSGTCDQRCLIYSSGGANGGVAALVLVSFDPSIYLKGVRSFNDRRSSGSDEVDLSTRLRDFLALLGQGQDQHTGTGKGKEKEILDTDHANPDEEVVVEKKMSASSGGYGLISAPASGSSATLAQTHPWASYEPAQYLAIGMGFHFAK